MNKAPSGDGKSAIKQVLPDTIGKEAPTKIPVELSAQFLKHFSEQLYSSPQKAFEELISNGWDAGADCVDVRIPEDLLDLGATLCVLDNGTSMDEAGLRELWRIAFSPKTDKPQQYGRNVVGKFGIGKLATYDSFVKFRISDNAIVVNNNHPFVVEHNRSRAEKELVRTIAMVNLLSDVYALDIGVDSSTLDSIRQYRDRLLRFRAMQRRQSGTYIARLLREMQNDSEHSKRLEQVVSDALTYLGFSVRDLAKSGEPEGVASAYVSPTPRIPTNEKPNPPLYSFTFDAKSSKHEVAKTGNISLDAVREHRNKYGADYALVVAPGYNEGALELLPV